MTTEKRDKQPQEKQNIPTIIGICVIAVFYIFMFSSQYIFGHNGYRYDFGPKGLGKETLSVDNWLYAPGDKQMEIVMAIEDSYIASAYEVNAKCMTPTGTEDAPANIELQYNDILVVHVSDIPRRFSEIRLSIKTEDGVVQFYNNTDAIITTDHIVMQSIDGYRIDQRKRQLQSNLNVIDQLNIKIHELSTSIQNIQSQILEIESQKKYMTAAQMQEASSQINTLKNEITQLENQISDCKSDIQEYELRNINLQKVINDLQKEESQ